MSTNQRDDRATRALQAAAATPSTAIARTTTRASRKSPAPIRPNAATIKAMEDGRRGKGLTRYANVQALFDGLHADD